MLFRSEKRFTIYKESEYKEEWYAYPFCIKEDGEVVLETIPLHIAEKVRDKLNEQQDSITELKSIINFASNEGDLIVVLMKEIIKLRQEVQECRAYETIEKGVSNYD